MFLFVIIKEEDNAAVISVLVTCVGAIYIGIFEMGLAFIIWLKALNLSEGIAGINNLIYVVPFLSLIIIHFTVGEEILISTIVGLILAGILLQRMVS